MDSGYLHQVVLKLFRAMDREAYRVALIPSCGRFCWDDERTYKSAPFERDICEIGVSALMNELVATGVDYVRICGGIHRNELDARDHITLQLYRQVYGRDGRRRYVFQGTAHLVYNDNLELFNIDDTTVGVRGKIVRLAEYVNMFSL